ncbi:nuclear transport factor 2 family protein [Spirosoma aerophilum]
MKTYTHLLFLFLLFLLALGTTRADIPHTKHITNPGDTAAAQLIRQFLTAVQQGDHTVPRQLLHPQVTWHQPGNHRFAGLKQSSKAVFQMVHDMNEAASRTLRLAEVKVIAVNGNQVACLVNWKAVMEGGGVLDVDNIDLYTLQDGKIVNVVVYSANLAQEDWFWGK